MHIKAHLQLPSIQEQIKNCGLDEGGKVQKYIDNFVLHHSEPYVPGKHIHEQGVSSTSIGTGLIIWDSPDANYLYEEKLMVDPFTLKGSFFNPNYGHWSRPDTQKILDPKGRKLEFHGSGKRGGHWFDRMLESEMDDLVEGVQHIVDGGK